MQDAKQLPNSVNRNGDNDKVRIVIADDDSRLLDKMARFLKPRYEVVGLVGDGAALVDRTKTLGPDIAIVDISMPGMNGIEATRIISASSPATRVIILSGHDEPEYIEAAFDAGAAGYVVKLVAVAELIPAIEAVVAGGSYRPKVFGG